MTKMKIYELCHENEVTVPICMYKSVFSTYFGDYTVPEVKWEVAIHQKITLSLLLVR